MKRSFLIVFPLVILLASPVIAHATDCSRAAKLTEEAAELAASSPASAEKKIRQAIDLCEPSASLHYNLALVLMQQGRYEDAEASLERSLELNQNFARAMNALAFLHPLKPDGDLSRAKELAGKALYLQPANKEFRRTLDMLNASVDFPPRTTVNRPDAVAVVIGNRTYKNSMLPAVSFALQDAAAVRKYLTEALGYKDSNVIVLNDATFVDFIKVFGDANDHKGILYNRTKKDRSDIFIYYSGHGAPDTNTKRPYLVPSDADPAIIKITGYPLETFYDNLAKLEIDKKPKSVTIVLDACFSGGYNEGMLIKNASPLYIETTSPALSVRNAVIFSSSKGNQISSWYPEQNHGLFTYHFLRTIKTQIEEGRKGVAAAELEKALLGSDGVNDHAWRLYNREQDPLVTGNKDIIIVP